MLYRTKAFISVFILTMVFSVLSCSGPADPPGDDADTTETFLAASGDSSYELLIVTEDGTDTLYVNDLPVSDTTGGLFWEHDFYFTWDGNFRHRVHRITGDVNDGHLIAAEFGSYTSEYTGSVPNAFRVQILDTTFFYSYSAYINGTSYALTLVDITGKDTPRAVDGTDPVSYLVINADTGVIADFDSDLNFYYHENLQAHQFVPE